MPFLLSKSTFSNKMAERKVSNRSYIWQGLLKFCLEATRGEDAPPLPGNTDQVLSSMDEERMRWLQVRTQP